MQRNDIETYRPAITGTTFEGYSKEPHHHYYPVRQFTIAEVPPKQAVRVFNGAHMRLVDGYVEVFGRGAKKTIPVEAMVLAVEVERDKLPGSSRADKKNEIGSLRDGILGHFAEAGIPVLRHNRDDGIDNSSTLSFRLPLTPDAFAAGRNLAIALSGHKNNL